MSEYKVQSGVSMPEFPRAQARKYPWDKMNVGDSVFFPPIPGNPNRFYANSSSCRYATRNGVSFRSRAFVQNGVDGVMIWRVK